MNERKTYEVRVRLTTSFPDPRQVIEEAVDDHHLADSMATVLSWKELK